MEDVLNLYEQPYDPLNPQVTFDERPCQLIGDVLAPLPMKEYAHFFKQLSEHYPYAEKITVVQDNLNTHTPASFYKVFKPSEAFALAQRFQMHYTPKNASWLNMAEIELAALSKQCLDRRIPDTETLEREAKAWTEERNLKEITVKWQFTNDKAREKFSRFYPNLS
jgi:hypothetical protein